MYDQLLGLPWVSKFLSSFCLDSHIRSVPMAMFTEAMLRMRLDKLSECQQVSEDAPCFVRGRFVGTQLMFTNESLYPLDTGGAS